MRFTLRRPCPGCPFRTDRPGYLRPDRAREIGEGVVSGGSFACHVTTATAEDESERVETADSQHCAGALLFCEASGNGFPQLARIAERLGDFDSERLDRDVTIARSLSELVEHHGGEPVVGECCHIVEGDCEAPAGYMLGGGVVDAVERGPTTPCVVCWEPVCSASCSEPRDDGRICLYCLDDEL